MALSKAKITYLRSLQQKKFRQKYNNFIVEGDKMVAELLAHSPGSIEELYALAGWPGLTAAGRRLDAARVMLLREEELKRISGLTTPNEALAVVRISDVPIDPARLSDGFSLYLDGIRDPGNLGAILRIADWFGIPYVFCSPDCVDRYNPKVIQASMGAFLRVRGGEMSLDQLQALCPGLPVLGAVLDGDDLFRMLLPSRGIVVIGSEARGISEDGLSRLSHRLRIPAAAGAGAESLNAAVAAGIICAVLRNGPGMG